MLVKTIFNNLITNKKLFKKFIYRTILVAHVPDDKKTMPDSIKSKKNSIIKRQKTLSNPGKIDNQYTRIKIGSSHVDFKKHSHDERFSIKQYRDALNRQYAKFKHNYQYVINNHKMQQSISVQRSVRRRGQRTRKSNKPNSKIRPNGRPTRRPTRKSTSRPAGIPAGRPARIPPRRLHSIYRE